MVLTNSLPAGAIRPTTATFQPPAAVNLGRCAHAVHPLRSAPYGLPSTVYPLRSTLYGLPSTVYPLRSTLYGLRLTLPFTWGYGFR